MATWHQLRGRHYAQIRNPHPTHYTCVTDPPGQPASVTLVPNLPQASAFADRMWEREGIAVEVIPPTLEGTNHD